MPIEKEVIEDLAKILADAILADYQKTIERWAKVPQLAAPPSDAPRRQVQITSFQGRRIFMMTRAEWARMREHEGKVVEIDLERPPAGSLAEAASVIAGLAADCPVPSDRIEVWPYNPKDRPTPHSVQEYLILEHLGRHLDVPVFAEHASPRDSPELRKCLRNHVFIVKTVPDKGRWRAKARAVERVVFLSTRAIAVTGTVTGAPSQAAIGRNPRPHGPRRGRRASR